MRTRLGMMGSRNLVESAERKWGIYVHIPFCRRRCPYCDFITYPLRAVRKEPTLVTEYINALCIELQIAAQRYSPKEIASIYIGGGTPSLLQWELLEKLMSAIKERFQLSTDVEVTIEVNPEDIVERGLKYLDCLRGIGINRISIGIQSFNPQVLKILGREHTTEMALEAIRLARTSGFDNINVDLLFGAPLQTDEIWQRTLEQVIGLSPEHVSTYDLTLERGTIFHAWHRRGKLNLPSEEQKARMYELAMDMLTEAGYEHYEISNFAKPGMRCHHNLLYWLDENYLGSGAAAHSSVDGLRFWNASHPKRYVQLIRERGSAVTGAEKLRGWAKIGERLMLGLRLRDGISLPTLERCYGLPVRERYRDIIVALAHEGLMQQNNEGRLWLTRKGLLLADWVMRQFLA